jgi:hypothetical protein
MNKMKLAYAAASGLSNAEDDSDNNTMNISPRQSGSPGSNSLEKRSRKVTKSSSEDMTGAMDKFIMKKPKT